MVYVLTVTVKLQHLEEKNSKKKQTINIELLTEQLKIYKYATPALKAAGYRGSKEQMKYCQN
jgi:hypothetical protein